MNPRKGLDGSIQSPFGVRECDLCEFDGPTQSWAAHSEQSVSLMPALPSINYRFGYDFSVKLASWTNDADGAGNEKPFQIQLTHYWFHPFVANRTPVVLLLVCTLEKRVWAPQARTLHGLRSLARDCDSPLPTANLPLDISEAALVALAGRHVNGRSLAVQQQRFDDRQQC